MVLSVATVLRGIAWSSLEWAYSTVQYTYTALNSQQFKPEGQRPEMRIKT